FASRYRTIFTVCGFNMGSATVQKDLHLEGGARSSRRVDRENRGLPRFRQWRADFCARHSFQSPLSSCCLGGIPRGEAPRLHSEVSTDPEGVAELRPPGGNGAFSFFSAQIGPSSSCTGSFL